MISTKAYTPEQVSEMLQLSKNTIYELISKGEIVAKKIGSVYRIPASSLAFIFTGLDYDLFSAEEKDKQALAENHTQTALKAARKSLYP